MRTISSFLLALVLSVTSPLALGAACTDSVNSAIEADQPLGQVAGDALAAGYDVQCILTAMLDKGIQPAAAIAALINAGADPDAVKGAALNAGMGEEFVNGAIADATTVIDPVLNPITEAATGGGLSPN